MYHAHSRLGLEKIHLITSQERQYTLQVRVTDWQDVTAYAQYSLFYIGDETHHYAIRFYGYSGTAGGSLDDIKQGRGFSTVDRENDPSGKHCAQQFRGAGWWYEGCFQSNPNGLYQSGPGEPRSPGPD